MQLGPTEQARLTVFLAAELARQTLKRGIQLNAPEAIALTCDEMHFAARAGGTFDDVVAAGKAAIRPDQVLDGVAALISEIRVEVLLDEGTRLIVLRGVGAGAGELEPGEIRLGDDELTMNPTLESLSVVVTNDSKYPVRISSHFPFDRVNSRLTFDRIITAGTRLDIPAGDTLRLAPGETQTVPLVRVDPESRSS